MKGKILAALLIALLIVNISSCGYDPKNENIDKTIEVENFAAGYIELLDTDDTSSNFILENEPNNGALNPDEIVRDVSNLGQLRLFSSINLTKASIWWSEEKEEYYIYLNEWDAYRSLRGLSSYHNWVYFTDNCISVDREATTIAIIDQHGKYDEPTILTYHFNRSNNLVELHAVPLNIKASSEDDIFFVNMHTADHGYYFLTSNMRGNHDWPLFIFETTDGGKSWNQILTNTFSVGASDSINIFKFISSNVGMIGFRYIELEDLCERTYFTVDGGLTWEQISQLPYPFDLKKTHHWYSEIIDLEQNGDRYYLTVEIHGTLVAVEGSDCSFPSERITIEFRFESKDLINWSLIET